MKTLIIRFGRLGDLLLTLPALRDLAAAEPDAERHFLVHDQYAPLLAELPELRRIRPLAPGRDRRALVQLTKALRAEGFERILDFHGSLRSRSLRRALGRDLPGGWWESPRHDLHRRLMISRRGWPNAWRPRRPLTPVWRRHCETVARALGPAYREAPAAPLPLPQPLLETSAPPAKGMRPLAIAPGAAWPAKIWPYFAELSRALGPDDPQLVLGSAAEAELCATVAGPGARRACGLPLPELAVQLSHCRGLVGGDSGLAHLAEALGLPVLTLFGPTVPGFGFGPRNPVSRVLETEHACRPCSLHGKADCRYGHGDCLRTIDVGRVLAELREMGLVQA